MGTRLRAAILGGKKYGWHYYTADARARDELAVSVAMSAGRKQLTKGSTVCLSITFLLTLGSCHQQERMGTK